MWFLLPLISSVVCDQMKLAALVFRHGDRSPIHFFPNDMYQEKDWPQGGGQLSKIGMENHVKNGKFFRARYTSNTSSTYLGLNPDYKKVQVRVRSTDYERTIMSAQSMLAGLFPPGDAQKGKLSPLDVWQPIPVHTVSADQEHMLSGLPMSICPKLKKGVIQQCVNDKNFQALITNKTVVESVVQITGMPVVENQFKMFSGISNVWDTLWCEMSHDMVDPKFLSAGLGALVEPFALFFWRQPVDIYNKQQKALISGVFVRELRERLEAAMKGDVDELKLLMYSGHDTTVAAVLTAYKSYDGIQPPYATVLMFELWQADDKSYYVTLTRRHHNETLVDIDLPGCGVKCPVEQFFKIAEGLELTNKQFVEICSEDFIPSVSRKSLMYIIALAGLTLLLSYFIFGIVIRKRSRYGYSDADEASAGLLGNNESGRSYNSQN